MSINFNETFYQWTFIKCQRLGRKGRLRKTWFLPSESSAEPSKAPATHLQGTGEDPLWITNDTMGGFRTKGWRWWEQGRKMVSALARSGGLLRGRVLTLGPKAWGRALWSLPLLGICLVSYYVYSEGGDQGAGLAFWCLSPIGQKGKGQKGASNGTNVRDGGPDEVLVWVWPY